MKLIDLSKIILHDYVNINNDNTLIFRSNININDSEEYLNKTLKKYRDLCNYYINIYDCYYGVSFNMASVRGQTEAIIKYGLEINIYKDKDDNSIFAISKYLSDVDAWSNLYEEFNKLNTKNYTY
jgi:hypothetical protein